MGTIKNFRTTADVTMNTRLKDGGIYIDWASLTDIRVWIYSDAQKALAGRVDVTIDQQDSTKAVLVYAGTKAQYPGVNRLIVQARYNGSLKTYDKPVFNFVPRTAEATGNVTIDEPETDVEIVVQDVSSSILDATILAALAAADRANEAAEAAEHMTDIHQGPPGPAGKAPYIDETTGNWFVWDDDEDAYVDSEIHAQGVAGNGIASWSVVESEEDGGSNVVTVTFTDGNSETFTYKNGHTGATPQISIGTVETGAAGSEAEASMGGTAAAPLLNLKIPKGDPGVAEVCYKHVTTLPTAAAGTMNALYLVDTQTANVYDVYYTSYDGSAYSWVQLGTTTVNLSDYATKTELNQLEAKVDGYEEEELTAQTLTANKYYNLNSSTLPTGTNSSSTGCYCAKISVTPGEKYRIIGTKTNSSAARLYATGDSDLGRLRYSTTGSGQSVTVDLTIEAGEAYLYVNLGGYDSQTDGFWKVTSRHIDGLSDEVEDLDDRVTALENAPGVSVVDALDSTSTTNALSANQGRVLNEDINGVTTATYIDQEIIPLKYFNTENSRVPAKSNLANATSTYCVYLDVTPGEVYRIYGKGNSGTTQLYALADADRYVVEDGTPGVAMNTRTTPLDLTIPEGVAILVVNLYQYDSDTDKVQKVVSVTTDCVKTRLTALEDGMSDAIPLSGKKVMFFGDSVTEFTYGGKGLVSYFAEASHADCYKAAVGGSRLSQRTTPVDTPTTENQARAALDICNMVKAWCEEDYTKQDAAVAYLDQYSSRVNALKNNPISGVDIVFFASGGNDLSAGVPFGNDDDTSLTTINGAINEIVTMLLTANPALKIYVYSPLVSYRNNTRDDEHWSDNWIYTTYNKTKPELIELIEKRVKAWHIPYINLYWNLGWNQLNFSTYYVSTDGTHPYKGFDVLGRRIYQQVVSLIQ